MRGASDYCRREPGPLAHARYRTVPEALIRQMLLLGGFAFELAGEGRGQAERDVEGALDSWVADGLPHGRDGAGQRLFDPSEVLNRLKWACLEGRDPFWRDHFVRTGRKLTQEWSAEEAAGEAAPFRNFDVAYIRRFNLAPFAPGARLVLRVPTPLAGPALKDVSIDPAVSPDLMAEVATGDGRLAIRMRRPDDPVVEVSLKTSFAACPWRCEPPSSGLTEAETRAYLRDHDGLIRVTPRVRELALALAPTEAEPGETVRAFWEFMYRALSCGSVHYDQVDFAAPGEWVLDHGWFDCLLGSALLISLCRARGIPARLVSGHLLYRLAPTNHSWAEFWTADRGWTPVDFLSWDLSAGGLDEDWRDRFFGALDYRMVTERLPFDFTGPMSVRLPATWHLVQTPTGSGADISFFDLDGALIYGDHLSIRSASG